jgi:hypothetical protein
MSLQIKKPSFLSINHYPMPSSYISLWLKAMSSGFCGVGLPCYQSYTTVLAEGRNEKPEQTVPPEAT